MDTFAKGSTVAVKVNGETVLSFVINADLSIDTDAADAFVTVPAADKKNDGGFDMIATVEGPDAAKTQVFVDDGTEALTVQGSAGAEYVVVPDMADKNGEQLSLVYWDDTTDPEKPVQWYLACLL